MAKHGADGKKPVSISETTYRAALLCNQTMFGRQDRRLLTKPEALCAKVLKGRKYFDVDFWNASCPRSASYTWCSIICGQQLLKQGVIHAWGIGNGKHVRICQDKRAPDELLGLVKPILPMHALYTDSGCSL
jgi:hypothetical protein